MTTAAGNEHRIPVAVERGGKPWRGWYVVKDNSLSLASAYGSRKVTLGRRDPDRLAEQLLGEVVDAWRGVL